MYNFHLNEKNDIRLYYLYLLNYWFLWKFTRILFCSESVFNHKEMKKKMLRYKIYLIFYHFLVFTDKNEEKWWIIKFIGSGHAPSHIRTTLWGYAGEVRHVRASPGWRRGGGHIHSNNSGLMLRHWISELPFWVGNLYILSIYVMINKKCAALRMYKCMGGPLGPPQNVCSLWLHKICARIFVAQRN